MTDLSCMGSSPGTGRVRSAELESAFSRKLGAWPEHVKSRVFVFCSHRWTRRGVRDGADGRGPRASTAGRADAYAIPSRDPCRSITQAAHSPSNDSLTCAAIGSLCTDGSPRRKNTDGLLLHVS